MVFRAFIGVALAVCCTFSLAAEDTDGDAYRYTLSMSGALISDNCERNWQSEGYISVYACNYELAQLYNLSISAAHFEQCAQFSRGDIIKIADCMTNHFNLWIDGQEQTKLSQP